MLRKTPSSREVGTGSRDERRKPEKIPRSGNRFADKMMRWTGAGRVLDAGAPSRHSAARESREMEWTDEGLVIGTRRHGEGAVILEVMTPSRGRHFGLVRGGRSPRVQPLIQPGNGVEVTWRARLEEHLGEFRVEPRDLRGARLIASSAALFGLATLAAHLRLLPERDPHPSLHAAACVVVEHLTEPEIAAALVLKFELALLSELGFGLDLSACAITGARAALAFVSPKSGRAVTREAGEPWRERLLPLPAFLAAEGASAAPEAEAIAAGAALTTFFLERHVYEPRGLAPPAERERFFAAARRGVSGVSGGAGLLSG